MGCETFAYFRQFFVNCNSSALDKTLAIAFFTFLKSVQDCTRELPFFLEGLLFVAKLDFFPAAEFC